MVDILINKYKILPNKTQDIDFEFPFDIIPKKYYRDFIRGFMDGDGSINKTELRFVFTSKKFMNQIITILKEQFINKPDIIVDFSYSINEVNGKTTKY